MAQFSLSFFYIWKSFCLFVDSFPVECTLHTIDQILILRRKDLYFKFFIDLYFNLWGYHKLSNSQKYNTDHESLKRKLNIIKINALPHGIWCRVYARSGCRCRTPGDILLGFLSFPENPRGCPRKHSARSKPHMLVLLTTKNTPKISQNILEVSKISHRKYP